MRNIVTAALGAVLLAGTAGAARVQAQADQGQKVFAAQKCVICHAVAAVGNKKGPLDGVGAKLSAEEIRLWITDAPTMAAKVKAERKPTMKAYATLPKDDLDALVAYLQSLKK